MSTVDPEFMPDPDGGDHSPICPVCSSDDFVICFWCSDDFVICFWCGGEPDEDMDCPVCAGQLAFCVDCTKQGLSMKDGEQ